jgi:hypothetical protein
MTRLNSQMAFGLALLSCLVGLAGCSSLYTLNHITPKDQTEKEWSVVADPRAAPRAEPAKATAPSAAPQCKEGASAEELRECDRLKRGQDSAGR